MEKIVDDFKVIKDKGKTFRQSILSLLVQWRDFEGQLNLSSNLESKENELEQREKDVLMYVEKKNKFLELKEEKLIKFVENYATEVQKNLTVQEERVRGLLEKLESKKLDMAEVKNLVEKKLLEMGERENHLVSLQDSLERKRWEIVEKENMCKEWAKEAKSKVEESNLMIENLEFKEKQVDQIRQIYENRLNNLNWKEKDLEDKSKQNKNILRDSVKSSYEQEMMNNTSSPNKENPNPRSEKEKFQQQFKDLDQMIKYSFEKFLHSKENEDRSEKDAHKRELSYQDKEIVEQSSEKIQGQSYRHSWKKYTGRTRQFGFRDPPYQNRFNGKRRR